MFVYVFIFFLALLSDATPQTAFDDYDVYAILEDVSGLLSLKSVRK